MQTAVETKAERMWRLVKEVNDATNDVSGHLWHLRPQRDDEREYRGGQLRFTGWKWGYLSQTSNAGFVAQWIWRNPDPNGWPYYVCLPAFCGGQFRLGESFPIGSERVTGKEPDENIIRMVDAGKKLLLEWVDEYLDSQHPVSR